MRKKLLQMFAVAAVSLACIAGPASAADKKPNILVIMGDDIGYSLLISCGRPFYTVGRFFFTVGSSR